MQEALEKHKAAIKERHHVREFALQPSLDGREEGESLLGVVFLCEVCMAVCLVTPGACDCREVMLLCPWAVHKLLTTLTNHADINKNNTHNLVTI